MLVLLEIFVNGEWIDVRPNGVRKYVQDRHIVTLAKKGLELVERGEADKAEIRSIWGKALWDDRSGYRADYEMPEQSKPVIYKES